MKTAAALVDKAFNSVSRTSKSVRMSPIELFAHLTVSIKDLQRRRENCLRRRRNYFVPPTMPNPSTNPPSHHRPFLRRQESHSVVPPNAAGEGHSPFEIPAYAGMVYLCTDDCRRIRRCLYTQHCEIPASAGMVCGGTPKSTHTPVPPVDHSCEGRNLTVSFLQQSARIRHSAANCPPPPSTISAPYPQINARNLPCLFAMPPLIRNFPQSPPPLQNRQSPKQSQQHR